MKALAQLGRWAASSAVALIMTSGSLALVAWMNDDPSPTLHEEAHRGPRTVPVAPTPPPPRSVDPSTPARSTPAPTPSVSPAVSRPAPAPPQIAGLAPTAGPGTIALGPGAGSLPSMGTLPESDLPDEAIASGPEVAARPKARPKPRYPRLAQRQGIEGFVTLRLRIDASGRVQEAVVVDAQPPEVFDAAALQTARRYRFTPARRGGQPVATTLQQTIRFELRE